MRHAHALIMRSGKQAHHATGIDHDDIACYRCKCSPEMMHRFDYQQFFTEWIYANMGEQLSALESVKFEGYLSALFELTELVYIAHKKGKIDDEYIAAWELRTRAAMSVPRIRAFWTNTKAGYRQSFGRYVDGLIES